MSMRGSVAEERTWTILIQSWIKKRRRPQQTPFKRLLCLSPPLFCTLHLRYVSFNCSSFSGVIGSLGPGDLERSRVRSAGARLALAAEDEYECRYGIHHKGDRKVKWTRSWNCLSSRTTGSPTYLESTLRILQWWLRIYTRSCFTDLRRSMAKCPLSSIRCWYLKTAGFELWWTRANAIRVYVSQGHESVQRPTALWVVLAVFCGFRIKALNSTGTMA